VPGFDITSILDFQPPRWVCPACRALINAFPSQPQRERPTAPPPRGRLATFCPECDTQLTVDEYSKDKGVYQALNDEGLGIHRKDLFAHATTLAKMVQASRGYGGVIDRWPTMRLFFEALSRAQEFVHFTSWGMSHVMIGALKATSMRVPVYGFVSSVADHARTELAEYPDEAPKLHAKIIPSSQGIYDAPHQKIIIIDGLLAFKGSTNLTAAGMRRADCGLDVTDVVTDFHEVTTLNNKYFSPVWKRLNHHDDVFVLSPPPF
jgi:phosphatidylserine/phosphatidylglycerophosphate/cardiolipin synthase-like enzyme